MTRKHVVTLTATDCRTGWIFKCSCGMRFIVRQRSEAGHVGADLDGRLENTRTVIAAIVRHCMD